MPFIYKIIPCIAPVTDGTFLGIKMRSSSRLTSFRLTALVTALLVNCFLKMWTEVGKNEYLALNYRIWRRPAALSEAVFCHVGGLFVYMKKQRLWSQDTWVPVCSSSS